MLVSIFMFYQIIWVTHSVKWESCARFEYGNLSPKLSSNQPDSSSAASN